MKQDMRNLILRDTSPFKPNHKNKTDGLVLLADIHDACIPAVFFDPQYRGVLEKLRYGNEGKMRGQKRCSLPQMSESTIKQFLREIERVLFPSGQMNQKYKDLFFLCSSRMVAIKIPLSFSELQGFATILAQFVRPFVRPFCAFDGFHTEIHLVFEYEKTLEIVVISRVFTLGTA